MRTQLSTNILKQSFKTLFFSSCALVVFSGFSSASNTRNDLHIIPEANSSKQEQAEIIREIGNITSSWSVLDRYNAQAQELDMRGDLGTAFATGVFSWNSLIKYIAYLMQFLSQLWLLTGGIMVVYAGYQYATVIFNYGSANDAQAAIKNAIIGILVIIFSYAILRGLLSMFVD